MMGFTEKSLLLWNSKDQLQNSPSQSPCLSSSLVTMQLLKFTWFRLSSGVLSVRAPFEKLECAGFLRGGGS